MGKTSFPFVSIITVNYNGKFFLENLFDSINNLDYPKDKLQVIMVDNGSSDDSVYFIKNKYPFIEILASDKNLGFAGGNNAGVRLAGGDYIAFINNDCIVDSRWLQSLLNTLNKKEKEGIRAAGACSKVLFYFKYLPLKITSLDQKNPMANTDENEKYSAVIKGLKIRKDGSYAENEDKDYNEGKVQNTFKFANGSIKYLQGFYDTKKDSDGCITRKIKRQAMIAIPVADSNNDIYLEMQVSFLKEEKFFFEISCLEETVYKNTSSGLTKNESFAAISFKISKEKIIHAKDIINSCGSMINRSFYAREIGFETFDEGTADKPVEVFAVPGSSFIVKKDVISQIGLFDEKFFTYYEDIDFSWRARLKGWKFFFDPGSVARHFHCGSGQEWSYNFTYHVLRNRLLMIYKCGWFTIFFKNYLNFCAAAFINFAYLIINKIRRKNSARIDIPIRMRIFFEFFILIVSRLAQRIKIRTGAVISDNEIKVWQQNF